MRSAVLAVLAALVWDGGVVADQHQCQSIGLIVKNSKTSRILVGPHDCRKNFTSLNEFTAKPMVQFPGQPQYANYTLMFISANKTGDVSEYRLHWLVANMLPSGSSLLPKGTTLAEYNAPTLPPPGKTAVYKLLVYEQKRWAPPLKDSVPRNIRSHFNPKLWLKQKDVARSIRGLASSTQFYAYRNNTPPHRFTTTSRPTYVTWSTARPPLPAPGFLPVVHTNTSQVQTPSPIGFRPDVVAPTPSTGVIGFRPEVVHPPATQHPAGGGGYSPPSVLIVPVAPPPQPQPQPQPQPPPKIIIQPIGILPPPQPAAPPKEPVILQPIGFVPQQPQPPPHQETHHHYHPAQPDKKKKNSAGVPLPDFLLMASASYLLLKLRPI